MIKMKMVYLNTEGQETERLFGVFGQPYWGSTISCPEKQYLMDVTDLERSERTTIAVNRIRQSSFLTEDKEVIWRTQRTDKVEAWIERNGPPGNGGAHANYSLVVANGHHESYRMHLSFQQGHMDEEINGILGDQLLAVVADRLKSFQDGPFACEENYHMLENIKSAMHWIECRQESRRRRGVQGEQQP